jgi:hypothetical protein
MIKFTKMVIVIAFMAVFLLLIYQQVEIESLKPTQSQPIIYPTASSTPLSSATSNLPLNPTTTPTISHNIPSGYTEVPSTIVSTQLWINGQQGNLVISGNVTNNSASSLQNLGLHIYSYGYPYFQTTPTTTLDTVIPIASGTYYTTNRTLTSMSAYETISVVIIIPSDLRGTTDYGNEVTVVQAI